MAENNEVVIEIENNDVGCFEKIKNYYEEKSNDQDFKQKMNVSLTLLLEFYRVLMGSLLILMVPQKCDDHVCSINENLERTGVIDYIGITSNFATLASMCILYYIEVKRENKMITYLEVNPEKARDNESVGEALENLHDTKKLAILNYDKHYCNSGYTSIGLFIVNAVFSFICIMQHYLDSKTLTVLLTNVLFMSSKLADVITTVKTDKNIFFSAYLKRKVQYNDVDPDKFLSIEDNKNHDEPLMENDEENPEKL